MRFEFNGFNIGGIGDFYEVIFEVYIEDKLVKKQTMEAPKDILMMNFIQTMEKIGYDKRPMKIKMIRPDTIWDNFNGIEKPFDHEVMFSNNAMLAWEENNKERENT